LERIHLSLQTQEEKEEEDIKQTNSVVTVREGTIPTERPLVGEVSANF
jgi:argonaute-like protein implicated in RNA metabolism and viral defense